MQRSRDDAAKESKSGLYNWAKNLACIMDIVMDILVAQAGRDAYGTLLGDSSGFSIMKYEDWNDAKNGIISRREFNKLHILMAPHGMIVTCMVTMRRCMICPFRKMYKEIPPGEGFECSMPLQRKLQCNSMQWTQARDMPQEEFQS